MDRALHSRRRVLLAGGTVVAAGLAGCTDSSRTDEAPADDDADDAGDGGMDAGNDSNETGGGELDEPPDDVEGDEGLGRGEGEGQDLDQGDAEATVAVAPGGELQFDPETVEIQSGGTVRWEWESADHTVTPDATPADADWEGEPEPQESDYVYEHTFETAGAYEYYCDTHPDDMTGSVVVED